MGILRRVLNEGVKKGVFHIDNIGLTAQIIHYCLKGLEVPYIKDTLGIGVSDAMAKRIGFTHFSVYTNHVPDEIEID